MEGRQGSCGLGGTRNTPLHSFPAPGLFFMPSRAQMERELLFCLDIFRKQCSSLPLLEGTSTPLSPWRQIFPSSLFSTCSTGPGPPTVPPHKVPRTTPTQAQPTLSGPADNCSIPPPFLASNPISAKPPPQRLQPRDFTSPASNAIQSWYFLELGRGGEEDTLRAGEWG